MIARLFKRFSVTSPLPNWRASDGMGLFRVALILLCISTPFTAFAQTANRIEKIEKAWRTWITQQGISKSALAISYRGKIVYKGGVNRTADEAVPIASLSKAITAICTLSLVQSGDLKYDTKLSDIFSGDTALPSGASAPIEKITMGMLLTHTSGLKPDTTQGRFHRWKYFSSERIWETSNEALSKSKGHRGRYFYNNGNYALLGAAIAKVAGQDYEVACRDKVFKPIGMSSVAVSDKWRAISSFGGWSLSAADYLKFANHYFGQASRIGRNPLAYPHSKIRGGAYYGLGVLFRKNRDNTFNFWHAGKICSKKVLDKVGAFFALWGRNWGVSVNYNTCPSKKAFRHLDKALWSAAQK